MRNSSMSGGELREADPEFKRALGLIREVQAAGALGMRVEEDKAKGSTGVFFFRRDGVTSEISEKAAEIRRLLKLAPDAQKFALISSPMRGADTGLTVNSRSMLQIMSAFATYIDVPEEHLADHRAMPTVASADEERRVQVQISSGKVAPPDTFAKVHYRNHWFWIDDGDWRTKRALTAVMFFFTLAETGAPERLPLITIPAQ